MGASSFDRRGVRVSQSYSRGEAWLLARLLEHIDQPQKLREYLSDPYCRRLEAKSKAMLAVADREAEKPPTARLSAARAALIARNRRVIADCEYALRRRQRFDIREYAKAHGLSKRVVAAVTQDVRASKRRVLTRAVADEMYGAYKTLRAAKKWRYQLATELAYYFRVPVMDTRLLLAAWGRRYMSETTAKWRRVIHDEERAEALFREITGASDDANMEAAE